MNEHSFDEGYPRRISQDWGGISGPIDAAVTDSDGDSYIFKVFVLYDLPFIRR